jgi:hypothetical protein
MYLCRAVTTFEAEQDLISDRPVSLWFLLLIAAHIPLAVVITYYSVLAALHAAVVVLLALKWSIFGERVDRIAYAAAYITGAEVFWRMTNDRLPWELGKYAVILLCIIGILRLRGIKGLMWPALAFALFLPSTVLTVMDFTPEEAKNQIAFNLSGPLALVLCARFFAAIRLTPGEVRRTLVVLIAPVAAIATVVFYGIANTPVIVWTTESNFATSGGFGPNQVSAALGLGALAAFLCGCDVRSGAGLRVPCVGALLWFSTQSILTFSRGGVYCAAGGAAASTFFLIRNPQTRLKVLIVGVLIYVVGTKVVWPQLDRFTDGAITARYEDVEATGRTQIGQEDLDIWKAHPVLGVGPGRSRFFHSHGSATHTEFTRLVSEHGVFGLAALVLLMAVAIRNVRRAETSWEKAIVVAFMCWSLLFMVTTAMRLVAPSFIFGIAFANFVPFSKVRMNRVQRAVLMRPSIHEATSAC